jgi:hypothetical protein
MQAYWYLQTIWELRVARSCSVLPYEIMPALYKMSPLLSFAKNLFLFDDGQKRFDFMKLFEP